MTKGLCAVCSFHPCSVAFDSFDILEDNEVRQGLKKFSDWPTYPQLYVDGELVGGLDIVKVSRPTGDAFGEGFWNFKMSTTFASTQTVHRKSLS